MWTEKDKTLFTIVNNFGEKDLEIQIEQASDKFSQLKQRPDFFTIFGFYDLTKDEFVWQNKMNILSYDFSKKYLPIFDSDETLKKLFEPIVKFDKKDMNVIPYLMEALNAEYSVVRFKSHTAYIYALVKLDDIKETFNFDEFDAALFFYRYYENIDKKYKSKQNKQKKQRSKEAKETEEAEEAKKQRSKRQSTDI
jgi:hypothetical protein